MCSFESIRLLKSSCKLNSTHQKGINHTYVGHHYVLYRAFSEFERHEVRMMSDTLALSRHGECLRRRQARSRHISVTWTSVIDTLAPLSQNVTRNPPPSRASQNRRRPGSGSGRVGEVLTRVSDRDPALRSARFMEVRQDGGRSVGSEAASTDRD